MDLWPSGTRSFSIIFPEPFFDISGGFCDFWAKSGQIWNDKFFKNKSRAVFAMSVGFCDLLAKSGQIWNEKTFFCSEPFLRFLVDLWPSLDKTDPSLGQDGRFGTFFNNSSRLRWWYDLLHCSVFLTLFSVSHLV